VIYGPLKAFSTLLYFIRGPEIVSRKVIVILKKRRFLSAIGGQVSAFMGSEMYKLEELIGMLNNKIDYVKNHQDRPGQLERASLVAGLSNTLGDLQSNMDSLANRINNKDSVKTISPEFLATEKELAEQDAKSTALLAQHIGKLEHTLEALGEKVKSLSVKNEDAMDKAMEAGNFDLQHCILSSLVVFVNFYTQKK